MRDDETEIKGNFATVTVQNDHGPNPECNRGQLYLALEGGDFTGLDANELRDAIDKAVGPREADKLFSDQAIIYHKVAMHPAFDEFWTVDSTPSAEAMIEKLDELFDSDSTPAKPYRPEPIVDAYFGAKEILSEADLQPYAEKIHEAAARFAAETQDVVNHPAHYTAYPVEVIELTEHMNFCRGNAVKYIARAGLKSPDTELEDLRKAQWYIEREIARLEGPEDPEPPLLPGSVKVGPQSTINIATGQPWEADA